MNWRKLGVVFCPDGSKRWAKRRAYLPTPVVHEDKGIIRVFYSALDDEWVGRVGYVDLDIENPLKIRCESREPVLSNGDTGLFDAHGVAPCCVVEGEGKEWLFYQGFQRVEDAPPHIFTGLAYRNKGESTFIRWQRTPILPRTDGEPWARSAPFVLDDWSRTGRYRMWYTSWVGLKDMSNNPLYKHSQQASYVIRHIQSWGLRRWSPYPGLALGFERVGEFGLARPWVVKDEDMYRMWYSIRSVDEPYKIGYAESENGFRWKREDGKVGISWSDEGWDSEMICFGAVVDTPDARLMFYDGNGHGETGFGVAVLEDE